MQASVPEIDVSKTKELFIDNYQLFNTCKTRGRVSFEEGEICERGKSRTKLVFLISDIWTCFLYYLQFLFNLFRQFHS